jgi:hypothetical protein
MHLQEDISLNIVARINHLSNTPLPEDLLERLSFAKYTSSIAKKTQEVTAIEVECFSRGIFIHYPHPASRTNHVLGRLIDSRI